MKISKTLLVSLAFGAAVQGASAQALQYNLPPRFPTAPKPSPRQIELQKKTDAGDVDAEAALGWMYYDGEIQPMDALKAFQLTQAAAEKGNVTAEDQLLTMYAQIGTPDDTEKALYWGRKAAGTGDQSSQIDLGKALQTYASTDEAYAEAIHWFEVAATGPNSDLAGRATLALANTYAKGTGVKVDEGKALYWLKQGVDKGSAESMNVLGLAYREGTGIDKDAKVSYKYFKISANKGNAIGQDLLGDCYANGVGTDVNLVKAFVWYTYASMNGSPKDFQKANAVRSNMTDKDADAAMKIIQHNSILSPTFDK